MSKHPVPTALSLQQFCEALSCGETTARDMIRTGELRAFRLRSKLLRIPSSEVDRLLSKAQAKAFAESDAPLDAA